MLEDDPDDRFLAESMLTELGYDVRIHFFGSGQELLLFLDQSTQSVLVLLDYNSGPESAAVLLKRLKTHEQHRSLPVIILSDSTSQKYIRECYALGASSYIVKPSSYEQTIHKIKTFFDYWLNTAEL